MKVLRVLRRKKLLPSSWKSRSSEFSGCFASPKSRLFSKKSPCNARQCSESPAQLSSYKSASPDLVCHLPQASPDSRISSANEHGVSLENESSMHSSEYEDLVEVFKFFDLNGDGKISTSELGSVLELLGDNPSEDDIVLMVKEADLDGDGFVNLPEFIKLLSASSEANCEELKAAFHVFDVDRNGFISAEELRRVFLSMGDNELTMEDCSLMIKGVDCDGDGFVSFEEFERMMRRNASVSC